MIKQRKKIDRAAIAWASGSAKRSIRTVIEQANTYKDDPRKRQRLSENECVYCYYTPRISGQAMTRTECGICGKEMMFSNTDTDVICDDCAKEHELCKHCGGDVHMRERRKNWPKL